MTIGDRIRDARKSAGLTQAQLAKKSGVAAISIHQYETGKRQPQLEQLIRISSALNVDMLDISELEGYMSEYRFTLKEIGNHGQVIKENCSIKEIYSLLSNDEKHELWDRLLTPLQTQLMKAFNSMNITGQRKAVENVMDLARVPDYQKTHQQPPQSPSPQDSENFIPEGGESSPEGLTEPNKHT